jgi:alginate biosynthesis protein AlgX
MLSTSFKRLAMASLATAALLACGPGARAAAPVAGDFTAVPCCQLCPEARDPNNYVTTAQQTFKALMKGQGDWLFRSGEDLRTDFQTSAQGYRRLQQVRDAFKARGIEVVMVYQPTRGLVERNYLLAADRAAFDFPRALKSYQAMLASLNRIGFVTPDLSGLTDEQPSADSQRDYFFRGDHHWTTYGAERTARVVAEAIRRMPAYQGIPKLEFDTQPAGRMAKDGTLHAMAGAFCGTSYASQYMDQFTTQPKAAASAGDLFGDAPLPQITLVGTSHSARFYNFDGYLKQYTNTDIFNVACAGCGMEGSMVEYLGSAEFREHPPKILIWELSAIYEMDQESVYRQILGLLDNGCAGSGTQLAQQATLKPNTRNDLLVNGRDGLHAWDNGRHLIDIQFADHSVKSLRATLWYLNGRHEALRLDKPTTVDTNGRFVFDMRDDGDWAQQTLLTLELPGPERDVKDDETPRVTARVDPVEKIVRVNNRAPAVVAPAVALAPLQVEVKLCKRNGFATAAQRTAHAGL